MVRDKKTKKHIPAIIGAALVIIAIIITAYPNRCGLLKDTTLEIPQGTSAVEIAKILDDNNVISWKSGFLVQTILSGKKSDLKYGSFTFKPGMSYREVIDVLCTEGAKRETVTFTIPEGYSVEMIVDKLVNSGIASKDEFEKALNADYDFEFLKNVNPKPGVKYKLQGYLFPSTYEFYTDETAENVIKILLGEFEKQYASISESYDNIDDIVNKAALIEREAKLDSERRTIAGVIENRIKTGMKLQIDASVVYAITDGMYDAERVYYKDLEISSPYNTYKYEGMPIGPICCPGIKSIEAALNPETHEWLYYRTDSSKNDGSHTFSTNFEEHKNKG